MQFRLIINLGHKFNKIDTRCYSETVISVGSALNPILPWDKNPTKTPQMIGDIPQEEDVLQEPEEPTEEEPEEEQDKEESQEDDD